VELASLSNKCVRHCNTELGLSPWDEANTDSNMALNITSSQLKTKLWSNDF